MFEGQKEKFAHFEKFWCIGKEEARPRGDI